MRDCQFFWSWWEMKVMQKKSQISTAYIKNRQEKVLWSSNLQHVPSPLHSERASQFQYLPEISKKNNKSIGIFAHIHQNKQNLECRCGSFIWQLIHNHLTEVDPSYFIMINICNWGFISWNKKRYSLAYTCLHISTNSRTYSY